MGYEIGLKPEEFWRSNFRELKLLVEAHNRRERNNNYRAAMVMAAIYNVNRGKDRKNKPYTPEEILGEKKQQPSDMVEMAKGLTELHGGEVRL